MKAEGVDVTIVGIFGLATVLGGTAWWHAGFAIHLTWWLIPALLLWLLLLCATGLWVFHHLRRLGSRSEGGRDP